MGARMGKMITVDIAFAPDSQTQLRLTLQLADDSRVIDAVNATGWVVG